MLSNVNRTVQLPHTWASLPQHTSRQPHCQASWAGSTQAQGPRGCRAPLSPPSTQSSSQPSHCLLMENPSKLPILALLAVIETCNTSPAVGQLLDKLLTPGGTWEWGTGWAVGKPALPGMQRCPWCHITSWPFKGAVKLSHLTGFSEALLPAHGLQRNGLEQAHPGPPPATQPAEPEQTQRNDLEWKLICRVLPTFWAQCL